MGQDFAPGTATMPETLVRLRDDLIYLQGGIASKKKRGTKSGAAGKIIG
jgi:hypothetical protein